jgi:hypothetical protein
MNTAAANSEFKEEPLGTQAITGLTAGQLAELAARVAGFTGGVADPDGRPAVIGLYRSVAMVVPLMRTNITQDRAGTVFDRCSVRDDHGVQLHSGPLVGDCHAAAM